MKQCAKRLLSLALSAVMVMTLIPATLTTTAHAAGSGDSGAFGISTPSAMTAAEQAEAENNPFGAMGKNGAFPLLVKSELYITYGWDGNSADNGKNYVKSYDTTETRVLPQFNVNGGTNRIGYNENGVGENGNAYIAASVDGFNPGSGKDEYVALLGLNGYNKRLELSITDKSGQRVSKVSNGDRYIVGNRSGDNLKWLTDCKIHQMNGFLSVACGDFDGDGKDSIIMYEVGAGNSQIPSLREFNVTENTSGSEKLVITSGDLVMGTDGMYNVLGGDVSNMSKTEAKNAPKVQMEVADTDKDGYDELVVTVSMNDTDGGDKMKHLGTQVFIFDKLSSGWTLTARFSMSKDGVSTDNSRADDRYRMVWGTSSVGNVIASDDSGGSTDFPEIVTVGLQDNESTAMHNINVDGNDMLVYSVIHCTGMTEKDAGIKNYQGKYEAVKAGNLSPNGFTERGFYESEDVSPLLQTKCFSYKGAAEADAVFISGTIFTWESDANGSGELKYLRNLPFYASGKDTCNRTKLTNQLVESVAAGNFDGNEDGREQIVSAFLLKEEGENNAYSGIVTAGWYPGSTTSDKWIDSTNPGGLCISKMGKAYVALTDFDCDSDSVIVKFENKVEKKWSDPKVMAILAASPYFHDIGLDNNSCTDYGIDRSSETSSEKSHTLTTNFVVGYEASTPLGNGGGVEATIENNLTWSSNRSRTITYSTNYSNNTEEHQLVVYRTPSLVYHFTNVNTGKPVYLSKALSPVTTMISLDEYNEQAGSYTLKEFDESLLGTPGIPNTYPTSTSQIVNRGGKDVMLGDNSWTNYSYGGTISKGVSVAEMRGKSFNYEFDFSFTAYGLVFGAKIGGGAGYGYETTTSVVDGTEISRSGTVEGVKEAGYDFNWNFVSWSTDLNGLTIPVCGYLVNNVTAPPSPAEDLNITNITADSLTLQWEAGTRPAEKYNIYRVMEASTDPYLYIGSVPGEGAEFSYTLNGLDSGTTYTFVVRGASGDTESVDGVSATACTTLSGSSITINPLQNTYNVAPNGTVTLSTRVATSSQFSNLQLIWQTRAAGSGVWREIDGETGTSLTLSNVSKDMDGNQYRLRVKATTTSTNVGYYYSNTATLCVSTTDTQTELTVTGASGGSGTLSSPTYDPYTGNATTVTTEPQYGTQTIEVPATFTVGGTKGQVYQVSGTEVYIGAVARELDLEGTLQYYELDQVVQDTGITYSPKGSALAVAERYVDASGNTVTMPTGGEDVTMTAGTGEDAVTYHAVALWNDAAAAADKYKKVWFQEQDGCYYTYDGATFTEIDLDQAPWSAYTVLGDVSYSSADKVVVSGSSTYLLSGLGGGESDVPTRTPVSSENYVTVGEATYSLSRLDPITVQETRQVITGYTTTTMAGTQLTLTATLTKANGGGVLSGAGADFIITDQTTGIAQYIHKTSNSSGVITTQWTAASAGLYSIQVSIPGTTTLSPSLTEPQYYYASSQGGETQYRLRLQANGVDVAGSVSYGDTVTLIPESKTGEGAWTSLTMGAGSGLSITAAPQGGTTTTLTGTSYAPAQSGKCIFTLVKTEGGVSTALAMATLNVTPLKLTVTPVWDGVIPESLDAVDMNVTDASGAEVTSLPNDDMETLKGALAKSSTYDFDAPGAGVFYVYLSWSEDSGKQNDVRFLNSAYSISFANGSFYKKANAAPVRYGVVGDIGGTMYATGANYVSFASGESQAQGTYLQFQATPDTGYLVKSWKVNGVEVNASSTDFEITQMSGSNTQVLAISSFNTTNHTSNGALLVEVEFTNQVSTVTYSAGGDGSLTAKTSQGTAVQSGASLAYGASVVFTAEPGEGQMVKEWKVAVNGETAKTYTWPESGEAYRENTLTLSDLAENSYTVYVEFTQKQTFTVASPVFVDGSGNPVNAGTITMTGADGKQVSSGSKLEQGKAITYTVSFNDSSFNTVNSWEYSTDGTNWSSASGSTGTTYTCCKGSTGTLYVRAVVSVAQTYALTWKVTGLAADDQATLSASSGGRDLTNGGSYAVNTPVSFHLEVDGKYYVTAWTNAEKSASDPASATLTLTKDTEVTVTVAKKPTVSWDASSINGGTISVTGTVNGTEGTAVISGGYVDPNTTVTVTATPDRDYVVKNINGAAVNTGKANGSVEANDVAVPADGLSVTASFLAKPRVTINSAAGGTVTVTGTKDGKANAKITDGGYVDYNSTVTVTLKPSEGYEVSSDINADYTDGDGSSTDDKFYTISNVQADQTITPAWTALKEYTIVYSVVDTNGDAEGGKNGTLSASASRKDMASFSVYEFDEVYEGSTISFTAEPDKDYCVKEWTVEMNGTTTHPMGADDKLVLENISADADVTVQFTYLGSKVIASAGENGALVSALVGENDVLRSITGDGILLNDGVSVQLTAEPDEGYEVESWLVNGKAVSGERGTTFTYDADGSGARIAVTFRAVKYSVSWSAENGAVKAAGYSGSSASIRGGTSVTFTAVPDDGYVVGGWAVNGKNQSGQTGSTFTWTVPAGAAEGTEYEIEAILVGGTYGVAVTDPAHGTISAEPDVTDGVTGGTSVTFTANAEDGYIVVGWTVNGKTTMRRSNTHTVTITGDATVTAVVVPEKYEVAYSVNESAGGTISAEGYAASPAAVPYDDSITFTAVPDTGAYYYIQAWQVDGQTVTNGTDGVSISADKTTLILSNVTAVHTVKAIFAKMTAYSVSYQVIGSGGSLNAVVDGKPLTLTPGQSADVWGNSALVFTASPAENNMVKEWKINGAAQENLSNTLTIDALRENVLVTVEFETPATMRTIPGDGTGYTISNIIKTPSDYGTAYEIRDRGTVTFTVTPEADRYLTELKINGIDCLTSTGTNGSENKLTIRNNGNGSYTITVANVKQDIALAATALEFQAFPEELSTVPTELQDKYTTVAELQNALRTEVKRIDSEVPNSQMALFDIVLKYTEDGFTWVEADKNHFPAGGITVSIPYSDLGNTDSSYTFTVIHMFTTDMNGHRIGDTERITPATTKTGIQFTVTSLSPFAIGWSKYSAPSGGGGGGGGAAPAETVIIKSSVNGKVTANNTSAEEDDVVTLTVEPDKGYTLETLTVTDKNGNELKLKDKGNGKYTFTMPDSKVTVKATFMEDNSMLNFFVDVPADAYYYDAVLWAAKEGITGGTDATHFSPNSTCTRAQAVTFLWRAAGSPAPESRVMIFTDVAADAYYADAVAWAVEQGITKGTSDTTFSPDAECSRAQIVTFLWRSQESPDAGSVNPFTDVAADAYYADAVLWAAENGITGGTTATTFSPDNDCTRTQIVTFLYRCTKNILKEVDKKLSFPLN